MICFVLSFCFAGVNSCVTATKNGSIETQYKQSNTSAGQNIKQSSGSDVALNKKTKYIVASRTNGVAPLAVFFNTRFSAGKPNERPFHDYEYSWDFDDLSSGKWGITENTKGSHKNKDKGPVAAHVFEKPGSYTVKLRIKGASGIIGNDTITINVKDPDIVYSGNNTICISQKSLKNFAGCPKHAKHIAIDDIIEINRFISPNKRILLHRNSSWNASETVLSGHNIVGPVTIGAYGTCDDPDSRQICKNAPVINLGDRSNFISINKSYDWRIQDLSFIGTKANNSVVSSGTDLKSILILRIKSDGFNVPIAVGEWKTNGHDQVMVVDCDIQNGGGMGMWIGSERLVIMGNRIRDTSGEHNIRVWQAFKGVISHNILSGSRKLGLKLHSPGEHRISKKDGTLLDNRSENIVISDNVFGTTYAWAVAVSGQNKVVDERLNNVLIEKNRFLAGYGPPNSNPVQTQLFICASNVTVRNNIFDGTSSPAFSGAIAIEKYGSKIPPTRINIYHNTIYKADTARSKVIYGMYIYESKEIAVKNNLVQLPKVGARDVMHCGSGCANVDLKGNLLTDGPRFADAKNNDFLLRNFELLPGSPAIDYGISSSVLDDFYGKKRSRNAGSVDVGAYEFQSN